MSEKQKAKVISFPQQKLDTASEKQQNTVLDELKAILSGDVPTETQESATPSAAPSTEQIGGQPINVHFTFNGGSHQIAGGNIETTGPGKNKKKTQPLNPNAINAKQKKLLLALRDEIVEKSDLCGFPRHPGTVMKGLNNILDVDSYHDILLEDFSKAKNHLESYIAAFDNHLSIVTMETTARIVLWNSIKTAQALLPAGSDVNSKIILATHLNAQSSIPITELIELYELTVSAAF